MKPTGFRLAIAWLICVALIAAATWMGFPQGALSTDVLKLLPSTSTSQRADELAEAAVSKVADRVVWATSSTDAAAALESGLRRNGLTIDLTGRMTPEDRQAWLTELRSSVLGMLDDKTQQDITQNGAKVQQRRLLTQLYSPVGAVSNEEWTSDPFLLMRSLLSSPAAQGMNLTDGWVTAKDDARRDWYVLVGQVPAEALTGDGLKKWIAAEKALRQEVKRKYDAQVVGQGVVYYSHHAADQAERDVKRLGSASIVLLVLFLWGAFRSFRPVVLCLLSVSVGALCGTAATLAVFGSLHAVTLVMCLSLIGISADYTTYYLVRRRWAGADETPQMSIKILRPSLLHALLTTCLAYGLMLMSPFPGLRQLALFAVCGLAGAWLTVVAWFPLMVDSFPVRALPSHGWLTAYVRKWDQKNTGIRALFVCWMLVVVAGLTQLDVDDDPSALQMPPSTLAAEEKVIGQLLGRGFSQAWFAVTAPTLNEALVRLEVLRPVLAKLEKEGVVKAPLLLPIHPLCVQKNLLKSLKSLEAEWINRFSPPCADAGKGCVPYEPIKPQDWLNSRVGKPYRSLVATLPDGQTAIFVPVTPSVDKTLVSRAQKAAAMQKDTYWIHRRADFGMLFETFRHGISLLIAFGMVALSGMLVGLFGWRRGVRASLPVLGGLMAGLAVTGLMGTPLNLFSLFALVLVMGIGVDYTVFFQSQSAASDKVFYAMAVALGSTLLSLGILVLSETPAVSQFGLVLSVGVLTAFLLAPAVGVPKESDEQKEKAQ